MVSVSRPPCDLSSLASNGRYPLTDIRWVDGNGTPFCGAVPRQHRLYPPILQRLGAGLQRHHSRPA